MSSHRDIRRLTPAQHEERIRAAGAKSDMARLGHSLTRAAHANHVRPAAVLRWFSDSLARDRQGRYVAQPDDEVFVMTVTTTRGVLELEVRGSRDREAVGRHYDAIRRLLDPAIGDPGRLLAMRGTVVGGDELETDPDIVEELWLAGELDFVAVYVEDV